MNVKISFPIHTDNFTNRHAVIVYYYFFTFLLYFFMQGTHNACQIESMLRRDSSQQANYQRRYGINFYKDMHKL